MLLATTNMKLALGARASRTGGEALATVARIVKKRNDGNMVRIKEDEWEGNAKHYVVPVLGFYFHRFFRSQIKIRVPPWDRNFIRGRVA